MKYKLTNAMGGKWRKLEPESVPQPASISSNTATISSYNASLHLTADIQSVDWSTFMELTPGDSGLITITQDGNGPWTFYGGNDDDIYLAGDVADITTMTASDCCTVGWFYNSESTSVPGSPAMFYFVSEVAS